MNKYVIKFTCYGEYECEAEKAEKANEMFCNAEYNDLNITDWDNIEIEEAEK